MSEFYGIDLGTTYSCIAIIDSDDIVTVITNTKGDLTTPSVVALDDKGKWSVGKAAKSKLASDPDNVVAFIKREMSTPNYTVKLQGKTFTPVDISAKILEHLVEFANKQRKDEEGKDPIYDVVITVPAYFGKLERDRTLEAGKQAGLNVLQLINEPTAAALSYGRNQGGDKKLMVYDLGGGTFDVSIMEFRSGIANTLSTRGDHHLGGADWDRAIVDIALEKVGSKWDNLDKATQNMMLNAAEEAKKTLTDEDEYVLTFNYKGIQNVTITREAFEAKTKTLMGRTRVLVDEALDAAKLTPSDIDEVLLVGGSSYMPMVSTLVNGLFPNSEVKLVDPNRAVAKGAAMTAAQNDKGYVEGGLTLGNDKGSRAYGIKAMDGNNRPYIHNLITINDDLEIHKSFDNFTTNHDNQTSVEMHFYESESENEREDVDPSWEIPARGNNQSVTWGHPVRKGTPIRVEVSRNKSGEVRIMVSCEGVSGEFYMDTERKGMASY